MRSNISQREAATAAFPSPAQDYGAPGLDLTRHLIPRPASTFLFRVEGEGLHVAGVRSGDELIVDRSLSAQPGAVVVVIIDGSFVVGKLVSHEGLMCLQTESVRLPLTDEHECWGVATAAIHHLCSATSSLS